MGDFNSQIGKEDSDEEDILRLGKYIGHTYTNENGEYMKNFLRIHKMNVISMRFDESLLVTWSNGNRESQIDHVVIAQESVIKTKFVRAAWTAIQNDHKLIKIGIYTEQKQEVKKQKLARKILEPNALQYEERNKTYAEELRKHKTIEISNLDTTEAYAKFTKKLSQVREKYYRKQKLH